MYTDLVTDGYCQSMVRTHACSVSMSAGVVYGKRKGLLSLKREKILSFVVWTFMSGLISVNGAVSIFRSHQLHSGSVLFIP